MDKEGIEIELREMCEDPNYFGEMGSENFKCEALRMIAIGIHSVAHALYEIEETIGESCYDLNGESLAENLRILAEAIGDVKFNNSISVKVAGTVETIQG